MRQWSDGKFTWVTREYPERDAQGKIWLVRQWSDGTFTRSEVPPTPSPTATPVRTFTPTPTPMAVRRTPAAPSNLRATIVEGYKIRLDWNDNSNDETGFRLKSNMNHWEWIPSNMTTDTEGFFFHRGTTNVCWSVASTNDYGDSDWTSWVCINVPY